MNDKIDHRKERDLIREFDKELFLHTGTVAWFIPGIFSFIELLLIAIPVQEMKINGMPIILFTVMFAIWLSYFVLIPYIYTTDTMTPRQPKSGTYDILKYLPISKRQYIAVRMRYLFRYFSKLVILGLIIQCTTSMLTKNFGAENVLYVIGILFILPLIAGWLQLLL